MGTQGERERALECTAPACLSHFCQILCSTDNTFSRLNGSFTSGFSRVLPVVSALKVYSNFQNTHTVVGFDIILPYSVIANFVCSKHLINKSNINGVNTVHIIVFPANVVPR